MDLDQYIQVINTKDKNFSPEERHKWKMPELPPVLKGSSGEIPVSVQELVYGGKAAGVGNSAKSLDRHNELLYSSEEVHGRRKDRGPSEGLETHVFQRKSPKDKGFVEEPKNLFRRPEEGQHSSGSSSSLNKCQTMESKPQRAIRREIKSQTPSGKSFTHRIT
ncbi:hypothetical protein O181_040413 [Austropuccinia psidii MF-1]|uniref:Uncharacterized protein n=1 Tax=Austropuccinia psidii MF-1 TaxID=1389203 RepID=A0A9Q3DH58_9BASI|nr:hypothetical protein [Austropuccinia psidii MF-1]